MRNLPVTEQVWVFNASPLILLGKIDQLGLVERLSSRLIVPQSVFDEIAAGEQDRLTQSTMNWAQRYTQPDIAVPVSILNWDVGPGESQVLAQCLLIKGSKAVLDDDEARAAAQSHRVRVFGTLGIILRAKQSGLIAAAKPLIEQLLSNGSYLSDSLVVDALGKVGE
jgi:predicted nucleic acid-binding protein